MANIVWFVTMGLACEKQRDMVENRNRIRDDIAAAGVSGVWVFPGSDGPELHEKGAYILAIKLDSPVRTDLSRLGSPRFTPGSYLYVGSAQGPGGMIGRVNRHFRRDKTIRWHVDRLTSKAVAMAALLVADGNECTLVQRLSTSGHFETVIPGFGSSDCNTCESHLLKPIDDRSAY